ncbi:MAG TPA: hypothetical protein VMH04_19800 [Candidatus Solibacter sp.]|nr:hypothetical protein [Candidatus Solibacter sp.]
MPKTAKKKKHTLPTRELLVQMQINRSNATAGGSGANVAASALISVMVTLDGVPVTDLGATAGNQVSAINLPAGWTLTDGFNVRPGGCGVSVTEFLNEGSGLYDIRIVPLLNNTACVWLSGEYIYAVQIKVTRTIGGKSVVLQGGTLGKLIIP